jgi:predicted amidohydrolase YtcJ
MGGESFLIPGLWDMHLHLEEVGEVGLKLFIANGVTDASRDAARKTF